MPADRRLLDSSSMTPPPAPEIEAMTCTTTDEGFMPKAKSYPEMKALVDEVFGICSELRAREKHTAFDDAVRKLEDRGEVFVRAAGNPTALPTSNY